MKNGKSLLHADSLVIVTVRLYVFLLRPLVMTQTFLCHILAAILEASASSRTFRILSQRPAVANINFQPLADQRCRNLLHSAFNYISFTYPSYAALRHPNVGAMPTCSSHPSVFLYTSLASSQCAAIYSHFVISAPLWKTFTPLLLLPKQLCVQPHNKPLARLHRLLAASFHFSLASRRTVRVLLLHLASYHCTVSDARFLFLIDIKLDI